MFNRGEPIEVPRDVAERLGQLFADHQFAILSSSLNAAASGTPQQSPSPPDAAVNSGTRATVSKSGHLPEESTDTSG